MRRFDRSNHGPSRGNGPRALHRSEPPFDGSMVRLDPDALAFSDLLDRDAAAPHYLAITWCAA
jgi:hypothetical protein